MSKLKCLIVREETWAGAGVLFIAHTHLYQENTHGPSNPYKSSTP